MLNDQGPSALGSLPTLSEWQSQLRRQGWAGGGDLGSTGREVAAGAVGQAQARRFTHLPDEATETSYGHLACHPAKVAPPLSPEPPPLNPPSQGPHKAETGGHMQSGMKGGECCPHQATFRKRTPPGREPLVEAQQPWWSLLAEAPGFQDTLGGGGRGRWGAGSLQAGPRGGAGWQLPAGLIHSC